MARIRISKQLEKSVSAGSIISTDVSNEAVFLAPGTNGQVLTIASGVPAWSTLTLPSEYDQYANVAAFPATGVTDVIYYATAENAFYIWNGSAYVTVPTAGSFTIAGNSGTSQTISSGNTLTIQGAASSGVVTTASATDILTIGLNEVKESFSPTAAATTVTTSQTAIVSTLEVFRNGILQDITDDYTVSGTTITFVAAFAASTGAAYSERVKVIYRY